METDYTLTDEEFKDVYSKVPRLCVEIIIKTDRGVLMTLRDIEPCKDLWHIPGGTILYGESIDAAAKRIAKKELGIKVKIIGLAGYAEYPSDQKSRGWGWPIALQIFCNAGSEDFKLDKQAREFKFFKKFSDIPRNIIEEHKKILEKILT
ncbi:MAG: NUDIX domain-containing protein [Candidatus Yanofskybacteria bacterium]|nr:NUDIX domain-containing protein [Candidatus Yanofskybacteria bacterium]